MEKYLVGGAVRDILLGHNPKDLDYVVVGETPASMLALGFTQVGADFPVFLCPTSGDEHALARTERKTGKGYLGFEADFGKDVTLLDDLARRDLTINSMAMRSDVNGAQFLVDPYNGQRDLDDKVLRHATDAFREDPVRVLRLARFAARFGPDWGVAFDTANMVAQMATDGVLDELNGERVWKELSRAMLEPHPELFFKALRVCGALEVLFPELDALITATENMKHHPEGNAFAHTMLVLKAASNMLDDTWSDNVKLTAMMSALTHDMGKGLTPVEELPRHHKHEKTGLPLVEAFMTRVKAPTKMRERVLKTTRFHMHMHRLDEVTCKTVVKMFDTLNVLNDPLIVTLLVFLGGADTRGRLGRQRASVEHLNILNDMFLAYSRVNFSEVFSKDPPKHVDDLKSRMYRARLTAVRKVHKFERLKND